MRLTDRATLVRRTVTPLALVAMLADCATNPATGQRQLMIVSEDAEIRMGREADQQVEGAFGLYPDERVQAYVARLGKALAADSERKNLPWTFRVVDDPTVNAFALPGGFIYVTRGLMTHMTSEAELVSVLGHEIGHVTARHSAAQMSKAQFAQIGLLAGMIAKPELQQFGQLAQTGMGLMFLKFGRDAERQADDLGLRYMGRQGYDPREAMSVFRTLDRASQINGDGERLPSWLSSHPAPEDRAQRIQAAVTAGNLRGDKVEERAYLEMIDGMVFGENPREGFFEASTFHHPEMRFSLEYPRGWKTQNQRQAVAAVSPNQDAVVVLTIVPRARTADDAANEFFRQQGVRSSGARREDVNGNRAVTGLFQAQSQQSILAGRVAFVEMDDKVYRILGYTTQQRFRAYDALFEDSIRSFDRLTDRRYLDVQPKRIEIVDVARATSVASFAERSSVSPEILALINGVAASAMLPAGEPAKTVVGGRLPGEARSRQR